MGVVRFATEEADGVIGWCAVDERFRTLAQRYEQVVRTHCIIELQRIAFEAQDFAAAAISLRHANRFDISQANFDPLPIAETKDCCGLGDVMGVGARD